MKPQVPEGLHARYHHYRPHDAEGRPLTKGGSTVCTLRQDVPAELGHKAWEETVAIGEAYCAPCDNFNKKIGRAIALGRAVKWYRQQKADAALADELESL